MLVPFPVSQFVFRPYAPALHASAAESPVPPVVDFGPPSPEALAWKSTSAGTRIITPLPICFPLLRFQKWPREEPITCWRTQPCVRSSQLPEIPLRILPDAIRADTPRS
jgi:hypothetical protein